MTFVATINLPDGPNNPSDDQPKMEINNNSFIGWANVDHVGYNLNNGGTHQFVHLNVQTSDPTLLATQALLYSKIVGANTELFYRYGSAPQSVFQVTNNGAVAAQNGVSSLIGPAGLPLKIQWGQGSSIGFLTPITFPAPFITLYSVVATRFQNGASDTSYGISANSPTDFTFAANSASVGIGFFWIAIGQG